MANQNEIQDIEMGDEEEEQRPKINTYQNSQQARKEEKPSVNPATQDQLRAQTDTIKAQEVSQASVQATQAQEGMSRKPAQAQAQAPQGSPAQAPQPTPAQAPQASPAPATSPAPAPQAPPTATGLAQQTPQPTSAPAPQGSPAPATTPAQAQKQAPPPIKPVNLKARKRAILGCFGAFFSMLLILLIFSFVFIAQSSETSENPIAKLLGINHAAFINGLITFIHIIFLITAIAVFIITMMGLLKASTAKKDDKELKRRGVRQSLISGIILIAILIIWLFSFVYLDSRRIQTTGPILEPIITTPEETINLTAPISIKFDATNVPYNSNIFQIISYQWDFGDGQKATGQVTSHTYKEKGDGRYDVLLTVTRRNKTTGEEFEDIYSALITIAKQALSAVIEADPLKGEAPLTVKFDASKSTDPDGEIRDYEWDLDGDGEFDDAFGVLAEYEYEKVGKYKAALRIINAIGDFEIDEVEITVEKGELPEAIITVADAPAVYLAGRQYIFSADESSSPNGKIDEYIWDFGDGTGEKLTRTSPHTYSHEGTYTVILTVVDEIGKEGEARMEIPVGSPSGTPTAVISTTPALESGKSSLSGTVPFTVNFDAGSSTDPDNNIVDYKWDFDGDGTFDNFGRTVSHTYSQSGMYTAILSVVDADGNESNAEILINVEQQGVIAVLKADKIDGSVPLTVEFDASGSTYADGQITSYQWNFGDGTGPKLGVAKISHRYDKIGSFTATVDVIGADNAKAQAQVIITVREIPLSACFVSVFEEGPAPLETVFDPGCSTGTATRYFWDFGDGKTSSSIKPSHKFETPGEYNVVLEVSDAQNTVDRAQLKIKVSE